MRYLRTKAMLIIDTFLNVGNRETILYIQIFYNISCNKIPLLYVALSIH